MKKISASPLRLFVTNQAFCASWLCECELKSAASQRWLSAGKRKREFLDIQRPRKKLGQDGILILVASVQVFVCVSTFSYVLPTRGHQNWLEKVCFCMVLCHLFNRAAFFKKKQQAPRNHFIRPAGAHCHREWSAGVPGTNA